MSNLTNILRVGAELFHADRQTDGRTGVTKLIVAFRNFSNARKELRNTVSQVEELLAISEMINLKKNEPKEREK